MDHRATPAAPDLRNAWAKKGTRHRSTKTMRGWRGWGWNSVILYESTSLPCPWASQDSSCDICLRCEMHICDDRCCCVFPNISRNLSQIFGWTIQTPSIGPFGAFSEKPQVALLRHPSLERHRTTKSSVICAVATHCAWCLWHVLHIFQMLGHGFLVIPTDWSPTNLKFRRSKELQGFLGLPSLAAQKFQAKPEIFWKCHGHQVPWKAQLKSMDEVPTWSKKVPDWMDRMDIRSQRRIDVDRVYPYHIYTYVHVYMYIYILYWLVVSTPLKLLVSWDDYSQYMEK